MLSLVAITGVASLNLAVNRRSILAAAAFSTTMPAPAVNAKDSVAASIASGYVQVPPLSDTLAQIQAEIVDVLENTLQKKDFTAAADLYMPSAKIVDGVSKPSAFVMGSNAKELLASFGGVTSFRTNKITLDGEPFELVTTAHVQYTVERPGVKTYQGILRVQKTTDRLTVNPGGWKIDQDVFPLDAPKIYAMIQPVRKGTNVFMELDPKVIKAKF